MKKVFITGANGQLGQSLKKRSNDVNADWIFTDVEELDITNVTEIENFFEKNNPDVLVNCAAYTAVDKAEDESVMAEKINTQSPKTLGEYCQKYKCKFIHISTDYVFNGETFEPYRESDIPNPESVYGKTKLRGERAVVEKNPDAIVLRTSWLYSEFGKNFMKTILSLGDSRDELNVVCDQVGTPTWAGDLAEAIIHIINSLFLKEIWYSGIYHFSNQGVCSWYDFAFWIISERQLNCQVNPIDTKDYPTPAKRPKYSVLNKAKFESVYKYRIPNWTVSAKKCIDLL